MQIFDQRKTASGMIVVLRHNGPKKAPIALDESAPSGQILMPD
jgi:hypothetical protein